MFDFLKNHVYPILVGILIAVAFQQSTLYATYMGDATAANQTTILSRLGTSTDAANIDGTVNAGLQYVWDNRASFGTNAKPANWTCTIRTVSVEGAFATASCSGSEKMIGFGWWASNDGCSGCQPVGQGYRCGCGSGNGGGDIWVNCCQ